MEVTKHDIQFFYGQTYTTICEEFTVPGNKHPQVWVFTKIKDKKYYFLYYKLESELFWYELPPEEEKLAYAIGSIIGKKFNLTVWERDGIQMDYS